MLRRFDTLFLRLFLLMWVVLVASHFIAFVSVIPAGPGALLPEQLPTLPSLPPGNPFGGDEAPEGPGSPPGLPRELLWVDYGLRVLVIGIGAALGARWLSTPMRRLSRAAGELGERLGRGGTVEPLDERRGTLEVRETAQVFNQMATRLQEQFDARGLHMAALSHDLRTPLTRLRMRLEQLPEAAAQAAVADIREMDEMVDGTLAVLREQRDGEAARAVDVGALLQAMSDDLVELGHEVTLDAAAVGPARAHPAALRRIVGNLAGNALRYGGCARLALRRGEDGRVEIIVDDDGPGIPPDQLELAFRPWVRLAPSHARAGHGLGLAIARDLAERDGGELSLHNRPEGGLRALLRLLPV